MKLTNVKKSPFRYVLFGIVAILVAAIVIGYASGAFYAIFEKLFL